MIPVVFGKSPTFEFAVAQQFAAAHDGIHSKKKATAPGLRRNPGTGQRSPPRITKDEGPPLRKFRLERIFAQTGGQQRGAPQRR
jgi:hypothetical protein